MALTADATALSITGENDPKRNSPILQPVTNKKSHIREHPFMKEVSFHWPLISVVIKWSFFSVYYKWFKCFRSKCRYITQWDPCLSYLYPYCSFDFYSWRAQSPPSIGESSNDYFTINNQSRTYRNNPENLSYRRHSCILFGFDASNRPWTFLRWCSTWYISLSFQLDIQ